MTESVGRRELILTTAAEMFARKGIRSTTVREIADAVGMLSGSLYHYFDAKDSIVEEILMGFLEAIRIDTAKCLARGQGAAKSLHDIVLTSLLAGNGGCDRDLPERAQLPAGADPGLRTCRLRPLTYRASGSGSSSRAWRTAVSR